MTRPLASACVDVCRELLAGEPEMLADFDAIFTDAGTRWDRLPTDLRLGLADIVWERLGERGLAPEPEPSARSFIRRTELRCPTCGGAGDVLVKSDASSLGVCDRCRGSGTLGGGPADPVCARCFGLGLLSRGTRLRILTA